MTRHFLEVDDLSAAELADVVVRAEQPVAASADRLRARSVALLFEKASARTRNSSEVAVAQMGGHPVTIQAGEVGLDSRESVEDVARTLGCYHLAIGARVNEHSTVERMARALDQAGVVVPVVNLLSDLGHPCQAIADVLTVRQALGGTAGVKLAYVGDANNVCRSLALAAAMSGMEMRVAAPPGYGPSEQDRDRVAGLGGSLAVFDRPEPAVEGADVVYTDVWVSMGQESDQDQRLADFEGFGVDQRLMALAAPGAVVLHCLPAHRGLEISAEVVDGTASRVWEQAANRMHAMRGLLWWLADQVDLEVTPGSDRRPEGDRNHRPERDRD
ncbi:MAG: ornithine carbamoyltransferase [Acidimicrobiales bacterium]